MQTPAGSRPRLAWPGAVLLAAVAVPAPSAPQSDHGTDPQFRAVSASAPAVAPIVAPAVAATSSASDSVLRIIFMDVGQGDAVLVQAPEGQTALVDAGISLGSASIEVLPLLPRGSAQHNDRSVTLPVSFGDFKAFLSGDSEVTQLSHLVGQQAVPEVALLKAAHHGSDNGFTREFLRAASPEVVVVSVGPNRYGHPRPEALAAYAAAGASVLRTDMHGHVEIRGRADGRHDVVHGPQLASLGAGGSRSAGTADAESMAAAAAGTTTGAGVRASAVAQREPQLLLWVHADAPGDDNRNPNGEYAVIESRGQGDRAMGGWRLCDAAGHCFRFPPGTVLEAGGRIVVYPGVGRNDGERYYMGLRSAVWNNGGDTATLYDRTGAAVVAIRY